MKYKVGEEVKVISSKITFGERYIGQVGTIDKVSDKVSDKDYRVGVKVVNFIEDYWYFEYWYFDENELEPNTTQTSDYVEYLLNLLVIGVTSKIHIDKIKTHIQAQDQRFKELEKELKEYKAHQNLFTMANNKLLKRVKELEEDYKDTANALNDACVEYDKQRLTLNAIREVHNGILPKCDDVNCPYEKSYYETNKILFKGETK